MFIYETVTTKKVELQKYIRRQTLNVLNDPLNEDFSEGEVERNAFNSTEVEHRVPASTFHFFSE